MQRPMAPTQAEKISCRTLQTAGGACGMWGLKIGFGEKKVYIFIFLEPKKFKFN
jgi:hypothetical protein